MTVQNEIDDGLTEEERAALAEDDTDDTTAQAEEGADDGKTVEDVEAKAGAGTDAAADPAATAAADAGATAAEPAAADADQPKSQPVLIAPLPADAEARLTEIATQKADLLAKFDDGDVTAKEFQQQLDALAKQERQIERQQDRAEIAASMDQQRLTNEWLATCNSFVERNAIYKDNPRLYKALDAEVRDLAAKPETANWSGQKFLDEAHKALKQAFNLPDAAAASADKPGVKPRRELPPNLAKVPAADVEDTSGNRYAAMDRLMNSDPLAYEEAVAKMSPSERDAYMAA